MRLGGPSLVGESDYPTIHAPCPDVFLLRSRSSRRSLANGILLGQEPGDVLPHLAPRVRCPREDEHVPGGQRGSRQSAGWFN